MFGEFGRHLTVTLIDDYRGFLLAILPPGAFLGLGFLIAGMNIINARRERKTAAVTAPAAQPANA
jgi:electron transport complex protein RnfE